MSRISKYTETENSEGLEQRRGIEEWLLIGYVVSLWSEESVFKLDSGESWKTPWLY